VPGILNAICRTQARIDKLTGAEATARFLPIQEMEDEIVIVWEDLDNPELVDAEG